jgi:hypothetical protein
MSKKQFSLDLNSVTTEDTVMNKKQSEGISVSVQTQTSLHGHSGTPGRAQDTLSKKLTLAAGSLKCRSVFS